jgi:hypothetical protein
VNRDNKADRQVDWDESENQGRICVRIYVDNELDQWRQDLACEHQA